MEGPAGPLGCGLRSRSPNGVGPPGSCFVRTAINNAAAPSSSDARRISPDRIGSARRRTCARARTGWRPAHLRRPAGPGRGCVQRSAGRAVAGRPPTARRSLLPLGHRASSSSLRRTAAACRYRRCPRNPSEPARGRHSALTASCGWRPARAQDRRSNAPIAWRARQAATAGQMSSPEVYRGTERENLVPTRGFL